MEILRNRRRALVVVESPFDSFGPGTYEADELGFSNREMVPAEANQKEIYRDVDPLAAPWRKPSLSMLEGVGEALHESGACGEASAYRITPRRWQRRGTRL